MLFPAPYEMPEKKVKGAKSGPRRKGASDMTSEDDESHSSAVKDDDEEEENKSLPDDGRKRRTTSTNLEAKAPKRGKRALADNSAWDVDSSPERPPRTKPRAAS
ncbi:hypothetical protein ACQJBY_054666 [Aegilops geniculata]